MSFVNSPKVQYSPDGKPPERKDWQRTAVRLSLLLLLLIGLALNLYAFEAGNVANITPGMFPDVDMQQYMNPYQDMVINKTIEDLDRARMVQMLQAGDAAQAGGAFGGDPPSSVAPSTGGGGASDVAGSAEGGGAKRNRDPIARRPKNGRRRHPMGTSPHQRPIRPSARDGDVLDSAAELVIETSSCLASREEIG
jgi:hypothetical protein